jgi:hypothetical protein
VIARLALLFVPSLVGLFWQDPTVSIIWSLCGSVFLACVSLTRWFLQTPDEPSPFDRGLRPAFMFNFFMIALHVVGGACHALDAYGYSFRGWEGPRYGGALELTAKAHMLMLAAHAATLAGMKLAGFGYGKPRFVLGGLPRYALAIMSLAALGISSVLWLIPGGTNLAYKFSDLSIMAIIVEVAVTIWHKRYANLNVAFLVLAANVVQQLVSGWKGQVLFTVIPLAVLLYPAMRMRVVAGAAAAAVVWGLYVYPFGAALRPLLWYQGVERSQAIRISMDDALHMPFDRRVEELWIMGINRLSDVGQFEKYLALVPGTRPYYGFAIADEAMIGLVPRLFWPDKPDLERLSMERVYEAGIVMRGATVSAKASYWQEAYLSGGLPIVLIASVFLGLLMQTTSRLCEQYFGGYTVGTGVIYSGLFANAFHQPQNFLFFVGSVWGSILVGLALFVAGVQSGVLKRSSARPVAAVPAAAGAFGTLRPPRTGDPQNLTTPEPQSPRTR